MFSYWVGKYVWERRWKLILLLIPPSQGDWNRWEIWNGASFWQEDTSLYSHSGTFRSPNNIFCFHFLDIMTISDASMASSSSWILWTFLWIFLNGGRLLRQFGNMYDQLTHYTIHYDWGWTCILSSILFAKYIFIPWFVGYSFCCWAPSLHICGNQSS